MNHPRHTEAAFETVIEATMLAKGYTREPDAGFDRDRAIFPEAALDFIRATQPKEWKALEALHGDKTGAQVLGDLTKWMDANGSLATLRHGFKCYGKTLRVAFFKAAHGLNAELEARYEANRLGLTRQLHFSQTSSKVARCRNQRQRHSRCIGGTEERHDRANDRSGAPPIPQRPRPARTDLRIQAPNAGAFCCRYRQRVHDHAASWNRNAFSAVQQRARRRSGQSARSERPGYRTAYLWEEVLQRDSLLDLLARFIHLQTEEKRG